MNLWSLLQRVLTPMPESLCLRVARPGAVKRGAERYAPLAGLIWTVWVLISPWLLDDLRPLQLAVTYLSFALFIALYLRAWYRDRARLGWNIAAITALGLIVLPANSASWTYLVYACTLLPFYSTPQRSVRWGLVMLGAFSLEAHWVGFSPIQLFSALVSCFGLYVVNMVWRFNAQRECELRMSHDEVRRLAALAERERIGRDLHDLLGHTLSLIAIKSELADKLFERDPHTARAELQQVHRVAREALAEVRQAVTGIRSTGLAAERVSAKLLLESAGVEFATEFDDCLLPADVESALAFGLRELATNIERHARAHRARAVLVALDRAVELRVSDDGRGGAAAGSGNGLRGLQERLQAVGGSVQIDSSRGRGTQISLRVPAPALRQRPAASVSTSQDWPQAAVMPQPRVA